MRVIAGTYRSRPLLAPPGLNTRPTADRLRETLFNLLTQGARDFVLGHNFLDLYAGSGGVGIEALSRGAKKVTFVESGTAAFDTLRRNLQSLSIASRVSTEKKAVLKVLRTLAADSTAPRFTVVFLDPPYEAFHEYDSTLGLLGGEGQAILEPGGLVVAEHRKKHPLASDFGQLHRVRTVTQGDAALSFFSLGEATAGSEDTADTDPDAAKPAGSGH